MCTAAILGIAQLGLGLATSYGQYKMQKEQIEKEKRQTEAQNKEIEQQKQATIEIQQNEDKEAERENREKAAEVRAEAGRNGLEFSGSTSDKTQQYMNDWALNQQSKDLQSQMQINQYDYQKKAYDKQADKYGFAGNVASQLLNYASSRL